MENRMEDFKTARSLTLVYTVLEGEIMALKWQDVNFATGLFQVRRILTDMPARLNGMYGGGGI